jgi:putative endonuclease
LIRTPSGSDRAATGAAVELAAEQWLCRQGLIRIERNFRCSCGEIDLVMRHGEQLVFVEVRMRSSRDFGGAAASVTRAKQQRLINTAQWYLEANPRWRERPCRFDVVAAEPDGAAFTWIWLRDAFQTDH